jgi:UDP-hydrolysing UDP-N-acetyl-D-glucosamine 2-epimerase
MSSARSICFVTGTRAEFGLMRSALQAIRDHPRLRLQIVATGMHLQPRFGRTLSAIKQDGWRVDATVPWPDTITPSDTAAATGRALARLPDIFRRLRSDVVLVVGDRVEAFAAAAAAHLCGKAVAHVHGGDRAIGQVDDSLRHAIAKLAHIHFPATLQSADRVRKLGEDSWRIHRVGSPGVDGIRQEATRPEGIANAFADITPRRFALLVLHPTAADANAEQRRATMVLKALRRVGVEHVIIVYPNNDPGSAGIIRCWRGADGEPGITLKRDLPRPYFLGLMRDAAILVGNSSSGIIEAASFGTPVVDIGDRQKGRERSGNVVHAAFEQRSIDKALKRIWNGGQPRRSRAVNVYGGDGAGRRIADVLARLTVEDRLLRKLIAY